MCKAIGDSRFLIQEVLGDRLIGRRVSGLNMEAAFAK